MGNLVVFNDSHQSDAFEKGVELINKKLEKHELRVKLQFIEDYESDEGEFAWAVSLVPDDLPVSRSEIIIKDYREYLSRYGWKEMSTSNGNAWFGGKSHNTLTDYLPEEALKYNLEDLDFVVCGWQFSGEPNEEEIESA